MAVNKVIYGGNTVIDLTGDTVTSDNLVEGVVAHDKSGASITGTNPYEKTTTDAEVTSQADLIAQIQTALEGKTAAGGGGGSTLETCTVTLAGYASYAYGNTLNGDTMAYYMCDSSSPGVFVKNSTVLVVSSSPRYTSSTVTGDAVLKYQSGTDFIFFVSGDCTLSIGS